MRGVVDVDADSINERHPLGIGLDGLRREFGLRRDEADAAVIRLARVAVRRHIGRFVEAYPADIRFVHVGAQPDVIEIVEREDRDTRSGQLPELSLAHGNHAGEWGAKRRVAEGHLVERELRGGGRLVGPGECHVGGCHLHQGLIMRKCRRRLLCCGQRKITRLHRRRCGLHQLLGASGISLLLGQIELIAGDAAARRSDGALIHRNLRRCHLLAGPVDHDLLLVKTVINARQHRIADHRSTFVKRQLDDGGLHLREAQDTFVRLDIPGHRNPVRRRRTEQRASPSPEAVTHGCQHNDQKAQEHGASSDH